MQSLLLLPLLKSVDKSSHYSQAEQVPPSNRISSSRNPSSNYTSSKAFLTSSKVPREPLTEEQGVMRTCKGHYQRAPVLPHTVILTSSHAVRMSSTMAIGMSSNNTTIT